VIIKKIGKQTSRKNEEKQITKVTTVLLNNFQKKYRSSYKEMERTVLG
jgi:hypothetical protein